MKNIKIGFLPLYIKLYDDCGLTIRERLEPFYNSLADALENEGFDVIRNPFCCVKEQFSAAVSKFESEGADCIVTWHAAYSPSLESIDVLAKTKLPIVVLDTTETYDFSPDQDSAEINLCHGIHGVMDMCSMLSRAGKPYAIAAGHFPTSNVISRTARLVRAAAAACSLDGTKVGTIGGSFDGMGDFLISDDELKERFGVTAVYADGNEIKALKEALTEDEIAGEMKWDLANMRPLNDFDEAVHRKTVRNCLAVRRWIENHGLEAFTVNFREIRPESGLEIMPFMEACKAMSRGVGYAGEGDVLTAAITGALLRGFGDATFVEIFCPDWKNDSLFLSHMGEFNLALAADKPEIKEIPFVFGEADDPVVAYGCYKPGDAIFVNVYRDSEDYRMLISPVTMLPSHGKNFEGTVRGWMKPPVPVADFLTAISTAGVTHHSSLVYGASVDELEYFAKLLNLHTTIIK